MDVQQISDRLQLHRAGSRSEWNLPGDQKRVLVLMFPWLGAKEEHIKKYKELYTNFGLDVLTVKSVLTDFLWPPNSVKVAKHILKALDKQFKDYDHFIFHTISIGVYTLTILTMTARKLVNRKHLIDKFCGIVFDSIVVGSNKGGIIKTDDCKEIETQSVEGIDRMIQGVAKFFSTNFYIQNLVILLGRMYFSATKKHTLDFYEKALDVARDEPVKVPTLVLASKNDPMSDATVVQKLINEWKINSNLQVILQLWDGSSHAQHLHHHKEEYEAALKSFLTLVFNATQENYSTVNKSKL